MLGLFDKKGRAISDPALHCSPHQSLLDLVKSPENSSLVTHVTRSLILYGVEKTKSIPVVSLYAVTSAETVWVSCGVKATTS
jgi:hypothetical protein